MSQLVGENITATFRPFQSTRRGRGRCNIAGQIKWSVHMSELQEVLESRPVTRRASFALFLLLVAPVQPAFCQSSAELRRLDELDRKCEAARDAALPAIREQKIQECVNQPPSSRGRPQTREECERYWSDYGVMQRQRAALDLPECKEAFLARQQFRSR
jgi:hypothetical protein